MVLSGAILSPAPDRVYCNASCLRRNISHSAKATNGRSNANTSGAIFPLLPSNWLSCAGGGRLCIDGDCSDASRRSVGLDLFQCIFPQADVRCIAKRVICTAAGRTLRRDQQVIDSGFDAARHVAAIEVETGIVDFSRR